MARKPASSSIRSSRSIPQSTPSSSKNRRRLLQVSPVRRSEEPEGGGLEDQCAGAGEFGIKLRWKNSSADLSEDVGATTGAGAPGEVLDHTETRCLRPSNFAD